MFIKKPQERLANFVALIEADKKVKIGLYIFAAILGLLSIYLFYIYKTDHVFERVAVDGVTLTAKCRYMNYGFSPYVSVYKNNVEIAASEVGGEDYDVLSDCILSSVKSMDFIESEGRVLVRMRNDSINEINVPR